MTEIEPTQPKERSTVSESYYIEGPFRPKMPGEIVNDYLPDSRGIVMIPVRKYGPGVPELNALVTTSPDRDPMADIEYDLADIVESQR